MDIKNRKNVYILAFVIVVYILSIHSVQASNSGIIDTSKTGSITIHKYDMTAATEKGIKFDDFISTGKQNSSAEEALKDFSIKGVEFSYLRVGEVEQINEAGKVKLVYEIPATLQKILGLAEADTAKTADNKAYYTSQKINDKLAKSLEDNTATKDKLEDYMKNGTAMDETNSQGVTSADHLELGLYLVVETKVPEDVTYTTNPFFVQLPMADGEGEDWFYDVVCYPKAQSGVPTLVKKVRNNPDQNNVTTNKEDPLADFTGAREEYTYADSVTASGKEVLDYEVISKLPHITSSSTYLTDYTLNDALAKGITYGKDTVIAIYENKDAAKANVYNVDESGALDVWKSSDADLKFKTEYKTGAEDETMKISFTATGLSEINKKYSDKYLAVYYTAKVNSNNTAVLGDKGNQSGISLTWKRSNANYHDILKDNCIVYTFGLNVAKKFTDDKGNPTKVKFVVENTQDGYFLKGTGSDGLFYVTGKSATKEGATQFSPDSDGNLKIYGTEADTYSVIETHSDIGYTLLKHPVVVKITSTKAEITPTQANITGVQSKSGNDSIANDGQLKGIALADETAIQTIPASAMINDKEVVMNVSGQSNNALVDIEITNDKGFLLPQTGGKGIYFITIAGILIVAIGFIMRRKSKKQR